MNTKVRKGVFETNSSTQHTLTIQRKDDSSATTGRIPSDTVFKFTNSIVENIEDGRTECKDENDIVSFATEIDKLALCVAFCRNSYEALIHKYYWDYMEEADCDENGNYGINAVAKDKPYFKELYQAVKEVRNTELVLIDGIYELDSLNDDMAFEGLVTSYHENVDNDYYDENLVTFFKNIIFGDYTIFDELFPC